MPTTYSANSITLRSDDGWSQTYSIGATVDAYGLANLPVGTVLQDGGYENITWTHIVEGQNLWSRSDGEYPSAPISSGYNTLLSFPGMPMPARTNIHVDVSLKFVRSGSACSIYVDRDGNEVWLKHGTGRRVYDYADIDLDQWWKDWEGDQAEFLDRLNESVINLPVLTFCVDCDDEPPHAHTFETERGSVCSTHIDFYGTCGDCTRVFDTDDLNGTSGGTSVCERCLELNWTWCDECDGYYPLGHDTTEQGNCCESPQQTFTIRNDGLEPLAQDTRVVVSLPAGVISDEGLGAIANAIRLHAQSIDTHLIDERATRFWKMSFGLAEELGEKWQTKDGNYTKRLSRYAYKQYRLKVEPELISQVGNIANEHCRGTDYAIEVTRNLNLPREQFAHSGSCWWSEYYESRCAFKTNGGFGLRTFNDDDWVDGRAWVLPMRDTGNIVTNDQPSLVPTFETMDPDVFVVFNGYGLLEGYAPARIISQMSGWTYRKVGLEMSPMYINNDSGYLVGPEEIVSRFKDGAYICVELDQHSDLYREESREHSHV